MKLLILILILILPLVAQDLVDEAPPRLHELPTPLNTDNAIALTPALRNLAKYCRHHAGVRVMSGPAYTIPACAATPPACNSFPCCLPNERQVVLHSYNTWAAPVERDGDGTVTKGGDPILVLGAGVDARLAENDRLCIPVVTDQQQRAVVQRLLKPLFDNYKAWFVRRIPRSWKADVGVN